MNTSAVNFQDGNRCMRGEEWRESELTESEIETIKDMVHGYSNVTVTGVHVCENSICVNLAVNYHSRAKYPNNHREYQEYRSLEHKEWQGWF